MGLKIVYRLLHREGVFKELLFRVFNLNSKLEHLINNFLEVLNEIILCGSRLLLVFVYDVYKHFSVVSNRSSQRLQVVVNLKTN